MRSDSDRPNHKPLTSAQQKSKRHEAHGLVGRFGSIRRLAIYWVIACVVATACAERADISVVTELEYGSRQTLDVYSPAGGGPWPVVVLVHGAGLDPDSYQRFAELLARSGLVVFNIEWRVLAPHLAESLGDVACAVRYAKDRAAEFGGDPERVVLVGHSTGAIYAGEVATNGDSYPGDCGSQTSALTEGLALISSAQVPGGRPWSHDSLGLNPGLQIVVIHGRNDEVVEPRISMRTARWLEDAGYEVSTMFLDAGHNDLVLVDLADADSGPRDDDAARAVAAAIVDLANSLR